MGDVHLARAPETANLVVLKLLHSELSDDEMAVRRFRHEATLATFVESRHLARIFDAGVIEGQLFIAMEYIEGWPLARVIEELTRHRERPPISAAIDAMEGALQGLVDLHRARHPISGDPLRIIHRDISPKNIM